MGIDKSTDDCAHDLDWDGPGLGPEACADVLEAAAKLIASESAPQ